MKNLWTLPKMKGFDNISNSILDLDDKYTICVKYLNGKIIEYTDITNPWQYIAKVKKSYSVEDAWIKNKK